MRREFKNTIDYLKKQDVILLQGKGDRVLASDSHVIAMVPQFVYESEFMTASPRFIRLEDGEFARVGKKEIPQPQTEGSDLIGIMADYHPEQPFYKTHVFIEARDGRMETIYMSEDRSKLVYINSLYDAMLTEFLLHMTAEHKVRGTNDLSPLVATDIDDYGFFALPINNRNEMGGYPLDDIARIVNNRN